MASIATVVTMGFGSFGSVNLLPTLGYGISQSSVVAGPYIVADVAIYTPGAQPGETTFVFVPGITDSALFTPGAIDREIGQWQT